MSDNEIILMVPDASRLAGGILAVVDLNEYSVLEIDDNGVVIGLTQNCSDVA